MNRKLLIVMMLTAVVAAEGCRRGSGEKKPPVSVQKEADFMYTRKGDIVGAGLDPVAKVAPGAGLSPEQQKLAQAADEMARKAKEEADKKKRREDTVAMGVFLLNYRKANAATIYSHDDLKKALRRQKLTDMYDDLDKKNIDVVYLADSFNPNHVICYHKTVETEDILDAQGKSKTIEKGHPTVLAGDITGPKFAFVKAEELPGRIKQQEMLVCWYYYVQFAAPLFYRAGPEFEDFKLAMQRQDPRWLPAPPPASTPPDFFAKLSQRKPELLKNPPEPRSYDRFKKHLTENAPPLLLKLVEGETLLVSMKADLRVDGLIACRVAVDQPKDQAKTNQGITANAVIAPYDAEVMKRWIEDNRPTKK